MTIVALYLAFVGSILTAFHLSRRAWKAQEQAEIAEAQYIKAYAQVLVTQSILDEMMVKMACSQPVAGNEPALEQYHTWEIDAQDWRSVN